MKAGIVSMALCAALGTAIAIAQASAVVPQLDTLVEGASVVSGKAAPGSGPIDVFDTSTAARTKIGTATVTAPDGKFYCALKPPLVIGHNIVAVDKNGNVSAVATVVARVPHNGKVPE